MTAETLGVDEVGKRKLVQELQRTPSVSETVSETVLESGVRVDGRRRRKSEEVKGFDWGYGMGRKEEEEEEREDEEEEKRGYESY